MSLVLWQCGHFGVSRPRTSSSIFRPQFSQEYSYRGIASSPLAWPSLTPTAHRTAIILPRQPPAKGGLGDVDRRRSHRVRPRLLAQHQRPELWNLYNTRVNRGENIRVLPLSNWTARDIWQYTHRERIPLVPLSFAADRPVVDRDGQWIMVDDDRFRLRPGETPTVKRVRFRTMGDYPLTAAHESTAATVSEIIAEMLLTRTSERQGRLIDKDEAGSMEKKKREGYF